MSAPLQVLIPAYRPDRALVELVAELLPALRERRADAGVTVVDDGSGAAFRGLFDEVAALGANVVRYARNSGKGAAIRTGLGSILNAQRAAPPSATLEVAAPDATTGPDTGAVLIVGPSEPNVVTADADGQHTVADILRVAERLDSGDAELVLGTRDFAGSVPLRSRVGNLAARALVSAASGLRLRVHDTQTGLRGLAAGTLAWARALPGDRYEYEQHMLLDAVRHGHRIVEVPIETRYLDGNASSHFRPIVDSARVIAPVLRFAASSFAGFVIDLAMLFGLSALGVPLLGAVIGARLVSAGANFALNRCFVFRGARGRPLAGQLARYAALAAALLAANWALLAWLTGLGVSLVLAKVAVEAGLFVASFAVQRAVVFARRRRGQSHPYDTPRRRIART